VLNNLQVRSAIGHVVDPVARALVRVGLTPDAVTALGTVAVVTASLALIATGHLFAGAIVVTVCALSDMLDGAMARATGRSGPWGAFLDSTLDRVSDAAVFAGLILWYAGDGDDATVVALALYCMVGGVVVSYAKARAEGLGLRCDVGIAERTERLAIVLICTGLAGLGLAYAQAAGLWLLAVLTTITVVQRVLEVRRQVRAGVTSVD
jgi:CDP-diacylglycerol---glycerol-3-phosphate 3-phosphatidyltransferase